MKTFGASFQGQDQVLERIHEMRLRIFEDRTKTTDPVKPYVPELTEDERERIMERYEAGKEHIVRIHQ